LKETDLNEIARRVSDALPEHMRADTVAKVVLSEEELTIMADFALLQGALIRLVENAMDAMPDGGVFTLNTGRIDFGVESSLDGLNPVAGPCALISVTDTGSGIDARHMEMIFEPFFTTKTGNGKGLGLPTAYRVIKEHGGSMKVESTSGQGTVVNVYLPLTKPEAVNMLPIPLPPPYGRHRLASE
jgi:signal transduction histidine kinase